MMYNILRKLGQEILSKRDVAWDGLEIGVKSLRLEPSTRERSKFEPIDLSVQSWS